MTRQPARPLTCELCGVPAVRDRWSNRVHADGSACVRRCSCGVPMAFDAGLDLFVHPEPICAEVHTFGRRSGADLLAEVSPEWAAEKVRIDREFREVCASFTDAELASLPPEFFYGGAS